MVEEASVRIMEVLDDVRRAELEGLGSPVHFPPGQTIFWEGQPSRSVLIIQEGNVKVTRKAADGTEVILAIRGPGEVMGEEGVLMDEPRAASVATIAEVSGLDIKAEDLLAFVDRSGLWPVMYQAAVRRRRQADQTALLARLDVRNRLARWLLELVNEVGKEEKAEGGWVIAATLSQQDIASRIGASRDAVAIELRRLRADGVITTGRRRIVIHDLEALRNIASI